MKQLGVKKAGHPEIRIQLNVFNLDEVEECGLVACIKLDGEWYELFWLGMDGTVEGAKSNEDVKLKEVTDFIDKTAMLAFTNGCAFVGLETDAQCFLDDLRKSEEAKEI